MQGHELSPVSTPKMNSFCNPSLALFPKKFTFEDEHSFLYAEPGETYPHDEDVVNFESDQEAVQHSEAQVPAAPEHPSNLFDSFAPDVVVSAPTEDSEYKQDFSQFDSLPILERVTHAKWQVRLRAYQSIATCLDTGVDHYSDKEISPYERYSGWLKEMATDKNLIAQMDGLKVMLVYISKAPEVPQTTFLVAVELLDKCPISKPSFGNLVFQIFSVLLARDNECLLFGELAKRVASKRINEVLFILKAVTQYAEKVELTPGQLTKGLDAGKIALQHSHNEVRALGLKLCLELYKRGTLPKDAFLKGLKDVNPAIMKELCELLENVPRDAPKSDLLNVPEPASLLQFDNKPTPASDLRAMLHPKFVEAAYLTSLKLKQEVLLHLKKALSIVSVVIDSPENVQTLNLLMNYLDDSNTLVYTEVLQILETLVWKCPNMFQLKWKQVVHALCEKLKGSRKHAKSHVLKILTAMCSKVITVYDMTDLLVDLAKTHKNPQVREDVLSWVSQELERMEETGLREMDLLSDGDPQREPATSIALAISKRLFQISKKDVSAQVRDQAVKCLTVLLRLVATGSAAHQQLEELVGKLHKVRVQEIQRNPGRPSTAPGHESSQLLDMDMPSNPIPELPEPEESAYPLNLDLVPESQASQDPVQRTVEQIKELLVRSSDLFEFKTRLDDLGSEGLSTNLQLFASCLSWVLQQCSSPDRDSTIKGACVYIGVIVESLQACHPEECLRLQNLVLLASSFGVVFPELFHCLDNLFTIASKIIFLRGQTKTILSLGVEPWSQLPLPRLINLVRFSTQWIEVVSKQKGSVNYFQRAKPHELFQDNAYQKTYPEALLHEVEEFRSVLLSVSGESGLMKATGVLRRMRQVEKMMRHESAEMRIAGLDEFLKFAQSMQTEQTSGSARLSARHRRDGSEGVESTPTSQRSNIPVIIVPLEELKRLLEAVSSGLRMSKSGLDSDSYQTKALAVLKSLRELISVTEAEDLFPVLAKSLPVVPYQDSFNGKVYFTLSDWLSTSSVQRVSSLIKTAVVEQATAQVRIHLLKWLGSVELRSKQYQLSDLSDISQLAITGLNTEAGKISLGEEDKKAYFEASEELLRLLISAFGKEPVIGFFETQLVTCGALFQVFERWVDVQFPEMHRASVVTSSLVSFTEPHHQASLDLQGMEEMQEQLRVERLAHEETQILLEKLNADYMSQATVSYQLQQDLQVCKLENTRLRAEIGKLQTLLKAPKVDIAWTHPITTLEDLREGEGDSFPEEAIGLFSPVKEEEAVSTAVLDLVNDGSEASLCLFQHQLIASTDPNRDVLKPLISAFTSFDVHKKITLIRGIATAVSQEDISKSVSIGALKALFQFNFKFLSVETVSPHSALTQELQHLLGSLLEIKDRSATLCLFLNVLRDAIPNDFREIMGREQVSFLNICLKCAVRVFTAMAHVPGTFEIWLALHRLFERHPPESLTTDSPNLKELEQLFKVLRSLSDQLLTAQPNKAFAFLRFILATSPHAAESLYIKYIAGVLDKKHNFRISDIPHVH